MSTNASDFLASSMKNGRNARKPDIIARFLFMWILLFECFPSGSDLPPKLLLVLLDEPVLGVDDPVTRAPFGTIE